MRLLAARSSCHFVCIGTTVLLLLVGCGGGGGSSHTATIAIHAAAGSIAAGTTIQLQAVETTSAGATLDVTSLVTWSTSNASVATVTVAGLMKGVAPGNAAIRAVLDNTSASLSVTIGPAVVEKISVSPVGAMVFTGGQLQFSASATNSDGTTQDLTKTANWSVTPSSIASISGSGVLQAIAAGSFTVTASTGTVSGTVTGTADGTVSDPALTAIRISPATATLAAGATQQFTAMGTYSDQSTKDLTTSVTWSSSDTSALTITGAGLATATAVTTSTAVAIRAALSSFTASAAVTVSPSSTVTSLQVRPTSSSIAAGTAEAHNAIAFYSDGTQKDVSSLVTWSVTQSPLNASRKHPLPIAMKGAGQPGVSNSVRASDSGTDVLTVNQNGVDFANQAGAANVQAALGQMQSASVVLVTNATVNAISISSPELVFPVNAKQQFKLNGWFSDGSAQDLSLTANWLSSDTSIATVDDKGVVTALKAGKVTLTASFEGLTATKVAAVISADLIATAIRVVEPVVSNHVTQNLTVIGTFSDGSTQDLTPLASWSSSDPAKGTIDESGLFQSIASGRVQITSTVGGVSSVAAIEIVDATLKSMQILPVNPSFALGTSLQFTALAAFSDGGQVDLSDQVLWVSSDPSVLTINSQGLAKSGSVGTATVTASLLGVSQTSSVITVTNAGLTGLTLSPATARIAIGTHQQYQATGWFSDGSIEDVTNDVAWSTSDATVASVDNDGTVLGLKPGTCTVMASSSGLTITGLLTVTNATLASVVIAPGNVELPIGVTRPFTLTGAFSDGTTQDMSADAIWQSPTPSIVFSTVTGLGVGLSPGIGTLGALLGNFSSATQVKVTDATLSGIALTPAAPVIRVGSSQQMTAIGTFSDGFTQNLYLNAVFAAADNKVVNIGAPGLAVGTKIGNTKITASFRGKSAATTSFRVESGTLQSIALSPANPHVDSGGTQQLTATGTYADGTASDLTSQVTWSSSDPAVLLVDGNGVASARSVEITTLVTVSATLGSTTTSFDVTVNPPSGSVVTALAVTPASTGLVPGATQQFTALATYADGETKDVSTSANWSSSNPASATINRSGLATGVATGSAKITAQIGGLAASSVLTISPATLPGATLISVAVTPATASITVGATQQFVARGTYSDGTLQDLTDRAVWNSSNPTPAIVNSNGLATGLAVGATTVGATMSGIAGTAELTVSAPSSRTLAAIVITPTSSHIVAGLSQQMTATGIYSDGSTQDLTGSVSWTSSDLSIATVSRTGLVGGVGAGTASITATSGTQQSHAAVIVTAAVLSSAAISPSGLTIPAGGRQQLTLTGTFSDGSRQDLTAAADWNSLVPAVASVTSTGLVMAVAPGAAQVTASYSGQTVTSTLQVTSATLLYVTLSPQNASFAKGTTQQFTVTGTYSDGTTRDLTSGAAFTSSDPAVAGISSSGLATGLGIGAVLISVAVDGQTASTQSIHVSAATLVSIAVDPSTPTFAVGTTEQFKAIGTFSDGTTQDLSTQAVWSSSSPQVATIDSNGLATGGIPGATQISATFGGVTSTTGSVQVTPATLTALSITPLTAQIAKGTAQQFVATGTYSDGTTENLSSIVSWASSNGSVVSINAVGLAIGNGVGSAQISATFNGYNVSTTFSVTPATLVSIAFNPANPTLAAGTSTQVTVTGTFSDGSTQDLSNDASYASSNPIAVTVSSSGVIKGLAAGTSVVTVSLGGVTNTFTTVVTSATLVSITITPAVPPTIPKGTTLQFTASGIYSDGSMQDLSSTVSWTSSNPSVFTVDAHGLATGTGAGTAALTASFQGQSATTPSVQVTPAVPASMMVTPAGASLTSGGTQQYAATVTYTDATTQDVSSSTIWSSSNPAVASISGSGFVLALTAGSTTISGVYNSESGSTALTVVPVVAPTLMLVTVSPSSATVANGNTQQFTATAVYSDGSTQNATNAAAWQSSAPAVATVNSNGLAMAVSGGNTQIWATVGSVSGVATLSVSPATLVSLSVAPATATLANGTSQQYRAVGTLSDGSTEDLTNSVTWITSNSSVTTVNTSGFATSNGVGTATITAMAGPISGTAAMTVTAATVVSVQVSPAVVTLPAGGVQQLLATAIFTDGSSQNVTTSATYASSTPAVVTADSNGKLTAAGTGSATVTVSLGSAATSVPVVITNAALTSVAVTPATLSLAVGESQQMTATGTFSDGSTQDLTDSLAWSSSAPQIATVSSTGKVTVAQTGNVTISATNGTVTGTAALTATSAVVTAIAVTPTPITLAVGQTQQFAATATMSDGSQQTVTSSVHWSTTDATKGTISNASGSNGLLVATGAGSLTATATLNAISGAASVTVTIASLTSLTVSPNPVSLAAGTTQAMTVTGNYTDGSTANVTSSANWTTTSASVATVDAGSVLHGVTAGSATVTATVGSASRTDAVTVSSAVLTSIALSLGSNDVPLGLTTQLTATGTYSDGSTQNLTSLVQWSSSMPTVATVSVSGQVSTLSSGSTNLIATLGSVSQQTSFTVTAAQLQSIAVQASQTTVALGLSLQLTAIGTYSDSSTLDLTSQVIWSSQTPSVGVVSATGAASGLTTGSFSARATLGGVTGALAITVTSAVLQSITVTPANSIIVNLLGSSVQFTATGHYSDGSTQNITTSCHWAITSGLSIGSISQTGSFSPLGVGLGTLSATSGSISGSTGFTVISVI